MDEAENGGSVGKDTGPRAFPEIVGSHAEIIVIQNGQGRRAHDRESFHFFSEVVTQCGEIGDEGFSGGPGMRSIRSV